MIKEKIRLESRFRLLRSYDFVEVCIDDPCCTPFYNTDKESDVRELKRVLKIKCELHNEIDGLNCCYSIMNFIIRNDIEYECLYSRYGERFD